MASLTLRQGACAPQQCLMVAQVWSGPPLPELTGMQLWGIAKMYASGRREGLAVQTKAPARSLPLQLLVVA